MSFQELRGPLHFKLGGLHVRRSLLLDWYLMYHFPLILFLSVLFLKIKNCNIILYCNITITATTILLCFTVCTSSRSNATAAVSS